MSKNRAGALVTAFMLLVSLITATTAQAEQTNRCLQLANNSYAEAPSRLIPIDKDFTVEMWVYSSPSNNGKFVEFISQNIQPSAFYMGLDPNSYLRMGDSWLSTGVKLETNTWTHVALTHTATNLGRLYIDGNLKATTNLGANVYTNSGTNTRIGAHYWPTAGEFFTGCLDDIRIWSSVRTEKQIKDYRDLIEVPNTNPDLIANYSFDMLTGFYEATTKIYPDSEYVNYGTTQMFRVLGPAMRLPVKGNFISTDINTACSSRSSSLSISNLTNLPKILKVNGRDSRQTSVELIINGLDAGTCVGVDTFVKGTTEPITSTVGIVTDVDSAGKTPRTRMNLNTSSSQCSGGSDNNLEARSWWAKNGRFSQYSEPFDLPKCFGSVPTSESSMLSNSHSVTLVGEKGQESPWTVQTALRLKAAQLAPAATRGSKSVSSTVQDFNGCHVKASSATLQKIVNAQWVDVGAKEDWVLAKNCSAGWPYQPIAKVNLPDTTVLRWKITIDNAWELYSDPFIHVAGASAVPVNNGSSNTTTQSTKLESPTNFSVSLQGKEIQIRVTLPLKTRKKVTSVALISSSLGFTSANPLLGEIASSFAIFKFPTTRLSGKTGSQKVFIESRGSGVNPSSQLVEEIDPSKYQPKVTPTPSPEETIKGEPSLKPTAKPTLKPTVKPSVKAPAKPKPEVKEPVATVICQKGSLLRTFMAKSCPPGWKKS